uniref:Uncharacterized protein n=1 Tax=Rhipicephalus zambeziensis TaxID=60191 RepID=A0A224Y7V6_9ACAR
MRSPLSEQGRQQTRSDQTKHRVHLFNSFYKTSSLAESGRSNAKNNLKQLLCQYAQSTQQTQGNAKASTPTVDSPRGSHGRRHVRCLPHGPTAGAESPHQPPTPKRLKFSRAPTSFAAQRRCWRYRANLNDDDDNHLGERNATFHSAAVNSICGLSARRARPEVQTTLQGVIAPPHPPNLNSKHTPVKKTETSHTSSTKENTCPECPCTATQPLVDTAALARRLDLSPRPATTTWPSARESVTRADTSSGCEQHSRGRRSAGRCAGPRHVHLPRCFDRTPGQRRRRCAEDSQSLRAWPTIHVL